MMATIPTSARSVLQSNKNVQSQNSQMPNYSQNSALSTSSNKKKKKKRKGGAASANTSANANMSSLSSYENQHQPELSFYDHPPTSNLHSNEQFADDYASDEDPILLNPEASKKSSKKKKKKKTTPDGTQSTINGSDLVPLSKKPDRIWNTNTNEERERIKDFWLSLGEDERRSLVKVEKEAVLRKMKEQQKHSCSCSVCGRKRTAIEKELEVLYDAYYEELEQYANQQQKYGPVPPPSLRPPYLSLNGHHHDHIPIDDDDDDLDEDDDYSETDQPPELLSHDIPRDFFNFGNSLTVQGGILTVADDLLKNDGKKFIEMMEQLAERRMAREEEALTAAEYDEEEDYDDEEEDEEDYEDDEDDDEVDSMSDEQRMEEGRRMFQIFAARMFEQRVLTAYREKVSQERQRKLLEELDEENRLQEERELKKAKEKEKKKDKKRQQKQAKEEERIRRENEKAAEEAAQRAEELRKAEEARKKREELRLKKEAERRALDEERLRKEEERRKRQQEEREREAERERKRKEKEDRERKKKDEQVRKERERKEQREQELRERKEKEELERKATLEAERRLREEQERQNAFARQQKEKELRERESKERDARARKEQQQREVYSKRVQIQNQQLQQQHQHQQQQQSLLQHMNVSQAQQSYVGAPPQPLAEKPVQLFPSQAGKPSPQIHSGFPSIISPPSLPKSQSLPRVGLAASAPGQMPMSGQRIPSSDASDSPMSNVSSSLSPTQAAAQLPSKIFNRSFSLDQQSSPAPNPALSSVPIGLYGNPLAQNIGSGYRPFGSPLTGMGQQVRPQMISPQSRQSYVSLDYAPSQQQPAGISSYPFGGPKRASTTPIGLSSSPSIGGIGSQAPVSSVLGTVVGNESTSPVSSNAPVLDRRTTTVFEHSLPVLNGLAPSSPKSRPIQRPHPIQRPPSISKSDEQHTASSSVSDEYNFSPPVMGSLALKEDDGQDDDILYYQPTARHATVPLGAPGDLSGLASSTSSISLNGPGSVSGSRQFFNQNALFNDAFSGAKRPQGDQSPLYSSPWGGSAAIGGSVAPSAPWNSTWAADDDHKKL
ncbi:hypothetical protein V1512DRAFT_235697 [Lipomyces arxii]|uniref:uncharacterized protein n=1 Tax=Lipomyces arxii TaxID=56418 RepID=UPI0034CF3DD7